MLTCRSVQDSVESFVTIAIFVESFEGVDSSDALLEAKESVPRISAPILCLLLYEWIISNTFLFKIDMLTCPSVQASWILNIRNLMLDRHFLNYILLTPNLFAFFDQDMGHVDPFNLVMDSEYPGLNVAMSDF